MFIPIKKNSLPSLPTLLVVPILIIVFMGLGCDKGTQALKALESSYPTALQSEINEQNISSVLMLSMGYKTIISTFQNQKSSQKAQVRLSQLQEKVKVRLKVLDKNHKEHIELLNGALMDLENKSHPLIQKIKTHNSTHGGLKIKEKHLGLCLAEMSGTQFDKTKIEYQKLKISKILEISKTEVLVQKIYAFSEAQLKNSLRELNYKNEATRIPKFAAEKMFSMPCTQVAEIQQAYFKALENAKPLNSITDQIVQLNSILSNELL